jgi:hypothetical protein
MLREAYICDPRVKNDDEAVLSLLRLVEKDDIIEGLEEDEKALLYVFSPCTWMLTLTIVSMHLYIYSFEKK